MTIFNDSERLAFNREELKQLEELKLAFEQVDKLHFIRDPYEDRVQLISDSEVESFKDTVQSAIDAKVLEIYHLERQIREKST
jgi:hypothetical protein